MAEWIARYCSICREPGKPGEIYYRYQERYYCGKCIGHFDSKAQEVSAVTFLKRRVVEKDLRQQEEEWGRWMAGTDRNNIMVVLSARKYDD